MDASHRGQLLAELALEAAATLREDLAVSRERVVVTGSSLGAMGAAWFASQHPDLATLVLDSGPLDVERYISDEELGELDPPDGNVQGTRIREALGLPIPKADPGGATIRSRLTGLAVEGLRRGVIDLVRFDEITALVDMRRSERRILLAGIAHQEGKKVSRQKHDRRLSR